MSRQTPREGRDRSRDIVHRKGKQRKRNKNNGKWGLCRVEELREMYIEEGTKTEREREREREILNEKE